jgi:hypothetical protein
VTFDPNRGITIDHPPGADYLLVICPFWANNLLDPIPSKKWDKKARGWRVRLLRQNLESLRQVMTMAGVSVSDAAKIAISKHETGSRPVIDKGVYWPAWYKFKTAPRKHQAAGFPKLYPLKAGAMFMDKQTGKTKTTIDLACAHRMEGHIDAVLVLTKRTLRRNWLDELATHCPLEWSALLPETGDAGQRRMMRWLESRPDFPWALAGWESLSAGGLADLLQIFVDARKVLIVGDETTFIAEVKATRSKAAAKLRSGCPLALALTGTPAIEGPMLLFGQFYWLDPNIIGIDDFLAFRNRYAIMGGYHREVRPGVKVPTEIVGYQNLDELMGLIAPYTYQVRKTDAYDLPPKRPEKRTVELTKEQKEVYRGIKQEGVVSFKDRPELVLENVLGVFLRAHQVAGGWAAHLQEEKRYIGRDGKPKVKKIFKTEPIIPIEKNPKLIELCEVAAEFKGKEQGLIWAVYQHEIEAIVKLMKGMGFRVGELHGGVPDDDRQPMVRAFKAGDLDLVVGNAATGGMGYAMHTAVYNIFYNNTFKAIDRSQAEDRNWGDGQVNSPIIVDILAEKTVDVTVFDAWMHKQDLNDYVRHRIHEFTKLLDGEV